MKTLTIIIPALNEEESIGAVIDEIPIDELKKMGYKTEILIIDNGSTDNTKNIALSRGATVIEHRIRGYGNAYKAGFSNTTSDIVATGDADLTYPFVDLPTIIQKFEADNYEFLNTNRLSALDSSAMSKSHIFGNRLLTMISKKLFSSPFEDSQSGMWVFKRYILDDIDLNSSGMSFSQELKMETFLKGFRCGEITINYRARIGKAKLNPIRDSVGNITHLFKKRFKIYKKT